MFNTIHPAILLLGAIIGMAVLVKPAFAVRSTGLSTPGLRSEFFNRFNGVPKMYDKLATRIDSNKDQEVYRWLGTVPQMREMIGGRKAKGLRTESYTVPNKEYESTLEVDRKEIDDDQTGQIRLRINDLAMRAGTHKDYLISQLLINGGTAGYNSYDGVSFFNDAHVSGASGNQDNNLAPSAVAPSSPTVAEFKTAYAAAVSAMLGFKDDQGEPMPMATTGLLVIVPPSMLITASEALTARIIGNTDNVIQNTGTPICLPWLTTATQWYLAYAGGAIRPFIEQQREDVSFDAVDAPNDSAVFTKNKYLYGVRGRYAMTYGEWRYCVRSTFA